MRNVLFVAVFCVAALSHYSAFAGNKGEPTPAAPEAAPAEQAKDCSSCDCNSCKCCAIPRRTRTVTRTVSDACGNCQSTETTYVRYRWRLFPRRVSCCSTTTACSSCK
jgi:hypothetical protein